MDNPSIAVQMSNGRDEAYLLLKDHAALEVYESRLIESYILNNHDSWYRWSRAHCDLRPEDLIVVRSTTKTSSWEIGLHLKEDLQGSQPKSVEILNVFDPEDSSQKNWIRRHSKMNGVLLIINCKSSSR